LLLLGLPKDEGIAKIYGVSSDGLTGIRAGGPIRVAESTKLKRTFAGQKYIVTRISF